MFREFAFVRQESFYNVNCHPYTLPWYNKSDMDWFASAVCKTERLRPYSGFWDVHFVSEDISYKKKKKNHKKEREEDGKKEDPILIASSMISKPITGPFL